MPAQVITGWAAIYDNIRRWSRTVQSAGSINDDSIADACNTAMQAIDDLVIQAGTAWAIRSVVVADVTGNLGTAVEFQTQRLFIEEDLGITDLAQVYKLYRVDAGNQIISKPIYHCDESGSENIQRGAWLARWGDERWREDGDFNSDGNYDSAILLYNWGTALANGSLKVTYWFTPAQITAEVFSLVDANGDRTARPPLPPKLWVPIQEYAKLVLLETIGDQYKQNALWQRWHGTSGIETRVRTILGSFQLGQEKAIKDSFADEVTYDG